MSVDINLHNVKEIRVEERDSFKSNNPFKNNEEYMFHTRDIVFVQEDGTETVVTAYSDASNNLSPTIIHREED
tara:strand:- start:148 stop:366 length:219 start_codon:yes stop_codon:yes gene_type:complete